MLSNQQKFWNKLNQRVSRVLTLTFGHSMFVFFGGIQSYSSCWQINSSGLQVPRPNHHPNIVASHRDLCQPYQVCPCSPPRNCLHLCLWIAELFSSAFCMVCRDFELMSTEGAIIVNGHRNFWRLVIANQLWGIAALLHLRNGFGWSDSSY